MLEDRKTNGTKLDFQNLDFWLQPCPKDLVDRGDKKDPHSLNSSHKAIS